nr:hypothetical protein [Candidatus Njordarchaeota archaeon]
MRRITVKSEEGRNVLRKPIPISVTGVILVPWTATLGTVVATPANYIVVEERGGK